MENAMMERENPIRLNRARGERRRSKPGERGGEGDGDGDASGAMVEVGGGTLGWGGDGG